MRTIHFTLPMLLPTLNRWERMHWRERSLFKRRLAAEINVAIVGQKPTSPIAVVDVRVFRHSVGDPDADNSIVKALLDVLQPSSKRHPYGLGVISGDDPASCRSALVSVRERHRTDQKTVVVIRELAEISQAAA